MICFYHAPDLDGHCSGAIVKFAHPNCKLVPINHGDIFPWDLIQPDEVVFMVDFSLPMEDMLKFKNFPSSQLVWIDHHKSKIEEAEEVGFNPYGIRYIGKGACELTWNYLFPGDLDVPLAVKLLSMYDVWNLADKSTLPFQYGIKALKTDSNENMGLWNNLFENNLYLIEEIIKNGRTIIKYQDQRNIEYCKHHAFEAKIGYLKENNTTNICKAICLNIGMCNSKMFESVWNPDKYDLMIGFSLIPSKTWTVSLYSDKPEIDCSEIAKFFGGGGHSGAAGFQCTTLPFDF